MKDIIAREENKVLYQMTFDDLNTKPIDQELFERFKGQTLNREIVIAKTIEVTEYLKKDVDHGLRILKKAKAVKVVEKYPNKKEKDLISFSGELQYQTSLF